MAATGPQRLGLLQLHPGRVRTDRHRNATARLRTSQLACRRKRHPHPTRSGATGRPHLLGLLPRAQPPRAGPIVWNRANKATIEARSVRAGVGHSSYTNGPSHQIFEIWCLGDLGCDPRRELQLDSYLTGDSWTSPGRASRNTGVLTLNVGTSLRQLNASVRNRSSSLGSPNNPSERVPLVWG
jgi:hypothetical protein